MKFSNTQELTSGLFPMTQCLYFARLGSQSGMMLLPQINEREGYSICILQNNCCRSGPNSSKKPTAEFGPPPCLPQFRSTMHIVRFSSGVALPLLLSTCQAAPLSYTNNKGCPNFGQRPIRRQCTLCRGVGAQRNPFD